MNPGDFTVDLTDLTLAAKVLQGALRDNQAPGITDANRMDTQALCVAEEAGELVSAYRRWTNKARRLGTIEDVEHEIADVLIVTAIFAEMAGVSLSRVVEEKLGIIWNRGWREEVTP